MTRPPGNSDLLHAFREDFLPYLHSCLDPDRLSELLGRLAGSLGADGAILWHAEEDLLKALVIYGCVSGDWAATQAQDSAGTTAWRSGSSVLAEPNRGPYRPETAGQRLGQVASVPLQWAKGRVGRIELWWKADGRKAAPVAEMFKEIEESLNRVVPALLEHEVERRNYVNAISRLMMLYDIGKIFHSTLELSELVPLILARVQSLLEAESAAVWLMDPVKKNLYCPAAAGPNRAAVEAMRVGTEDAGLGTTAAQSEAVLLHDLEDPAWTARWGSPIRSLVAIPLLHAERLLGAIEATRGAKAPHFTEEDLRLLIDVGKQASVALRNAERLQVERRVKELNALMEISKEITATLDLDRVLTTTVNRITSVIPAERCSVSLLRKGRWEVSAIAGAMKVDRKDPAVVELEAIHVWLAGFGGDLRVVQTDAGIEADREETTEKFTAYFQRTGMRALTGLLLRDEEGIVGTLILESKDPESLTHSHNDLARIFANQVTIALRNALLYQQVPLIGVLHPLVAKKAKFAALPAARRRVVLGTSAAALALFVFFPWWSKPSGEARVLPARIQPLSAEVEGVVRSVLVREGERVVAGQVVAELAPDENRLALERTQSQYDISSRRVLQLEAEGNLGAARSERTRSEQAAAELDLRHTQLAQTQIRSPISGVMLTPRLDERVGQYLHRGDVFCQVADLGRAQAEVAIPEMDVGEIGPGQEAWLKLNTFPGRKFAGRVIQVSPQAREQGEDRFFDVIVEVPNQDQALRAGMMGRGKVLARRATIGYLALRAPARWIWLKVWKWLP